MRRRLSFVIAAILIAALGTGFQYPVTIAARTPADRPSTQSPDAVLEDLRNAVRDVQKTDSATTNDELPSVLKQLESIKAGITGTEPNALAQSDTGTVSKQVSREATSNMSATPDVAAAAMSAQETLFSDGFEVGGYPWVVTDPGWGFTTYRRSEGSRSLYCAGAYRDAPGPYFDDMDTWILAGPFDFSGYSSAQLDFDSWLDTELDYDHLWAGAISGDGESWSVAWMSGYSDGWERDTVDLTEVCGISDVYLFFNFDSDSSVNYEGAYVDNVVVSVTPSGGVGGAINIQGSNRYTTAIEVSKKAFPGGADFVVIATGENWPDALGGSALAGVLDAPVLLTVRNTLPTEVSREIERLGATYAVILGGTGAVGGTVESYFNEWFGQDNVLRIAGDDRYDTADRIAYVATQVQDWFDGRAFVATGGSFPDALAAAPLAVSQGWPLILAHPTRGLSSASKEIAMTGVTDVVILGGTGAVSSATEDYLRGRYGRERVTRLQGRNRYETAVRVAEYAVQPGAFRWDHSWDGVGITTGENFPDALAGGVLQGRMGSVMLLTQPETLTQSTADALWMNRYGISTVTFYGGTGAVSPSVRASVMNTIQ